MELDIIKTDTTWNDAAGSVNKNFSKLKQAIATLIAEGGGLDEEQLAAYLQANGYTTEQWIALQEFIKLGSLDTEIKADSVNAVQNKVIKAYVDSKAFGGGAYPRVVGIPEEGKFKPNTFYVIGETERFSLALEEPSDTLIMSEYIIQFSCPQDKATKVAYPTSIIWETGLEPKAGFTYRVHIMEGLASFRAWGAEYEEFYVEEGVFMVEEGEFMVRI